MYENKQKITYPIPEDLGVAFGEIKISVTPYLSLQDQAIVMGSYMEEYFSGSPTHVLEAEYKLVLAILDQCTDIQVDEGTISGILRNYKFWEDVKSKIKNYGEFRALLRQTLEEKKEQIRLENSLPMVIRNVANQLIEFVNDMQNTEITEQQIENAKKLGDALKESGISEAVALFKNRNLGEQKA